ncbi:MAG: hypothetical protein GY811_14030 [Myxococcales bacterium]|nr:hypothetical protein [Myxococcales bacterium]
MNAGSIRLAAVAATLIGLGLGALTLVQSKERSDPSKRVRTGEATNTWHSLPDPQGFSIAPTIPQDTPFPGEKSRRLLALYDSNETIEEEDDHENITLRPIDSEVAMVHRLGELPLNHLGLVLDYHDVNTGTLPDTAEMEKYLGVISWFDDNKMREPDAYLQWLALQAQEGRRVVVMEYLGAFTDLKGKASDPALVQSAYESIGGSHQGNWTDDSSLIAVVETDTEMMGFEQALPSRFEQYEHYKTKDTSKVYLKLERTDIEDSASSVAWSSPTGGFVMPSIAFTETRLGERYVLRWLINPFRYFEEAFGIAGWPRADFTTLNGRRIFYMHIDGDGLGMITELDYKTRCGEIVRRDVLTRYDLPVTASAVIGRVAPPPHGKGTNVDVNVARAIFALDNVEIGSHGYAHPMDWRAGEKSELSVNDLPDYELSGESEVAGTVAYINEHLAPPGKQCRIMLWTGWCNPSEEQLKVTYAAGVRNLNGGDPRMDSHYPSYTHLVPPVHQVGAQLQYFTSAANDYILTDDWTPPYYRFQNVVQTFENSGSPRRMVPVNIYIHYYIARNFSALAGLHNTIKWVLDHPLAPIFTSQYVDIARDFHWARMAEVSPGTWAIRKGPALRTVRFDDATIHIDLDKSVGVTGYFQDTDLGVTYVHLGPEPEAQIVTADRAPARPFLWSATHPVESFSYAQKSFSFKTGGVGLRTFDIAGVAPGAAYKVVADIASQPALESRAEADENGFLHFAIEAKSTQPIVVRVELSQ